MHPNPVPTVSQDSALPSGLSQEAWRSGSLPRWDTPPTSPKVPARPGVTVCFIGPLSSEHRSPSHRNPDRAAGLAASPSHNAVLPPTLRNPTLPTPGRDLLPEAHFLFQVLVWPTTSDLLLTPGTPTRGVCARVRACTYMRCACMYVRDVHCMYVHDMCACVCLRDVHVRVWRVRACTYVACVWHVHVCGVCGL